MSARTQKVPAGEARVTRMSPSTLSSIYRTAQLYFQETYHDDQYGK